MWDVDPEHGIEVRGPVITAAPGAFPSDVLHLSGHTEGSVCLYEERRGLLLSGDVLFAGAFGRTDLPGGSFPELMKSMQDKVLVLPDETRVLPGHGPETTIGRERATNPFLG